MLNYVFASKAICCNSFLSSCMTRDIEKNFEEDRTCPMEKQLIEFCYLPLTFDSSVLIG